MIEIEKKFILTTEQEEMLVKDAQFLGEKQFTDSYYDTTEYTLTTKDVWLRERDGKYELKVPMNTSIEERVIDQYRELETDEEIAHYLGFLQGVSLKDSLKENGYEVFCTITTTRKKYKKEGFGIDLDTMDFGYTVAEIESMTDDESKMKEAVEKILEFAKGYGLSEGFVRGKVAEYVRRNNPKHFELLIANKVIK
jgi:adenylate cyclase class IV